MLSQLSRKRTELREKSCMVIGHLLADKATSTLETKNQSHESIELQKINTISFRTGIFV